LPRLHFVARRSSNATPPIPPHTCGQPGNVYIRPREQPQVGGPVTLAFLFCRRCAPYGWQIDHVQLDQPPWSATRLAPDDRFRCPVLSRARRLAKSMGPHGAESRSRRHTNKEFCRPLRGARPASGIERGCRLSRRFVLFSGYADVILRRSDKRGPRAAREVVRRVCLVGPITLTRRKY